MMLCVILGLVDWLWRFQRFGMYFVRFAFDILMAFRRTALEEFGLFVVVATVVVVIVLRWWYGGFHGPRKELSV